MNRPPTDVGGRFELAPQDGQGYVFRDRYLVGSDSGRRHDAAIARTLYQGVGMDIAHLSSLDGPIIGSTVRYVYTAFLGLLDNW